MDRIDKILVDLGFARTRSHAKQLIDDERVRYQGKLVKKCGLKADAEGIEVEMNVPDYVSRGAKKVGGAVESFGVELSGKIIADVGASTGGFTDYCLQNGAIKSYAIDVGHDQLAEKLVNDSRVINMEGVNARNPLELPEKVDLVVVDLSFISLKLTLDTITSLPSDSGEIILLVKPQFEAGKDGVDKNGIVKSDEVRVRVLNEIYEECEKRSWPVVGAMRSPITGKEGNIEYLFHLRKDAMIFAKGELSRL